MPDPSHPARLGVRGELVLPARGVRGAAQAPLRGAARSGSSPRSRYNEALAFINGGLNDVSLSRAKTKITWGITVPWDTDHVFYVWFDALLNYYTALGFARDGEDLTDTFWPANLHVLGKDILKFHAVFWPAMLMAADLPLPRRELIHGYLLMRDASGEETKMSKSLGNVLDPFEVMDTFGTDALRYYCFREVSFGQDGGVSTTTFGERYESELANDYGNLASRTLAMIVRYRDGVVPEADVDPALATDFDGLAEEVCALLDERRDHPGARADLAARPAPEPLRRGAGALAARQGRGEGGGARHRPALARGGHPRGHGAAPPVHPGDGRRSCSTRWASADLALEPGDVRRSPRRRHRRQARAAVPQAAVIDSHTHLDRTPGDDAEIVAAARAAGVTRILTIGTDAESSRRAQAAAEAHDDVWFAAGHHPNSATGYTDAITDELREIARHPRCAAIGETGLDDYRDYAPRADQERAFAAHIGLARELGKPLVIHTRAADDDTIATLAARRAGPRGDPALLLDARPAGGVPRARLVDHASPATSPTPRRASSPSRPSARRSTASSSRPTPPT